MVAQDHNGKRAAMTALLRVAYGSTVQDPSTRQFQPLRAEHDS